MSKFFLFLVFGLFSLSGYAQNLEKFNENLSRCGMNFTPPEGFVETPLIDNPHMLYEYAVKNTNENFEIRYAVRALNEDKTLNNASQAMLGAILMNISGEDISTFQVNQFPKEAVQTEFNADWGGVVVVPVEKRPSFAQNYKYCMVVFLHKENKANAYIFYMVNSEAQLNGNGFRQSVLPIFYALKYNKE